MTPPKGNINISRISGQTPAPMVKPKVTVPPVTPEVTVPPVTPSPLQPFPLPRSAGLFASSLALCNFLGMLAGKNEEVTCRYDGPRRWWGEVNLPWQRASDWIRSMGGRAFAGEGHTWIEMVIPDEDPFLAAQNTGVAATSLDPTSWPRISLIEVLGHLSLYPGRLISSPVVTVVTVGHFAHWLLERAASMGLACHIRMVEKQSLGTSQNPRQAVMLRLQSPKGDISPALVQAIADLPHTVAAVGDEGLLVDVRCRLPFMAHLLRGQISKGEFWLLSSTDSGHWRLTPASEEVDGIALMSPPGIPSTPIQETVPAKLPASLTVCLRPTPGAVTRVDGVLLDDQELAWIQLYLVGRPLAEVAFLLPGNGRHLLVAPGGLAESVPFGIPLLHLGPMGFFLECGLEFYPSLPAAARTLVYGLNEENVVVATHGENVRFALQTLMPVWQLWTEAAPVLDMKLSPAGEALLRKFGQPTREKGVVQRVMKKLTQLGSPARKDRDQLLREAKEEELRGNLVKAAELLEEAGEFLRAGRLFMRAAQQ